MRYVFTAALLVAWALFLVGCGGGSDSGAASSDSNVGAPSVANAAGVAPMADMEGGEGGAPDGLPGAPTAMSGGPPGGMPYGPGGAMPGMPPEAGSDVGIAGDAAPGDASYGGDVAAIPGSESPEGTYPGIPPGAEGGPGVSGIPGPRGYGPGAGPPGGPPGGIPPGAYGPGGRPGIPAGGLAPGGAYPDGGFPGAGYPGLPGGDDGAGGTVGPGGVPGFDGVVAKPTTFDGLAKLSFQQGRERDAFQYLYAWGLTSDAGAAEVLSNYQWVPGLRRPSLAVRWGIGVHVTAPPNFSSDPSPIGTQQALGGRGSRGKYGDQEGGYGGPGAPEFPDGAGGGGDGAGGNAVTRYAGELGQKILDEFQARVGDGRFGKILKDAPAPGSSGGDGEYAGGAPAGPGGVPGFPGGDGGFPGGDLGGPGGLPGFGGRGGPPGFGGQPGIGGAAGEGAMASGLTMLGIGSEKDLREKARKNGIDVLAMFRVKVSVNRAGIIVNETELTILDASKTGAAPLHTTRPLTNVKVQQARAQNKDDGVDKELKQLFEFIDKELCVANLPEGLTPEVVKTKRVDLLAKGTYENPLPVLSEIRFYNRSKLLNDVDAVGAFSQLLGSEAAAKTLLEGKEEDRKKVVEKWTPKS